ncbi:hypothetical protein L7F22_066824 [Adiantum nelumboides]|nr:hypothetical protein [Adiantum nelumboides]
MADHDNEINKFCATAAQSAMVGMVISGRVAKACDVCGKERGHWYCAADLAYLCERCDGAVHSANPVASRHERARLGPNGAPVKKSQAPSAIDVKRDASAAVSPHPSAHFNPRKRPRSIRRHKPSSFHASKLFISSSIYKISKHNYASSHVSTYNNHTGSILASTQGIMIDNPRRSSDFIANVCSNELLGKTLTSVKAEPYNPVDIGDQVKVPDHLDDDHLLECLFDFRELHDDDLFLHQVPIYDPQQSQDLSLATLDHSAQSAEGQDDEEENPIINIMSPFVRSSGENSQCADFHSPELCKVEEGEGVSLAGGLTEVTDNAPALLAKCRNDADVNTIDLNSDICDLDQLDFDSVLQGNDDDNHEMDHSASMDIDLDMDVDMTSHDFIGLYPEHRTTESSGYAEVSFNHHGNCKLNDADAPCDGSYQVLGFDFSAAGGESPCTWLSKVKVCMQYEHGDDALLKDKLNFKTFSADSPPAFKLGLKLNIEDVLCSWSDRGTFRKDGYRRSRVASFLDFLARCFMPETNGTTCSEGEGQQLVSALTHKNKVSDGTAREASVLRYREKRHTRLFSKKIRYEVRKLNAEKRPRMKGRFVKRMTI